MTQNCGLIAASPFQNGSLRRKGTGRMRCARLLVVLACFAFTPLQAAEEEEGALEAVVQEAFARLELSEDQLTHLRPVFRSHFEAQFGLLTQYGVLSDQGTDNLENAQELGKHLESNNQKFEAQVAEILSDTQMSEFRRLQEESREAFRERAFASSLEQLGQTLELTDEQLAAATPILSNHTQTQLAIFEKHGVDLSGREKASMMTLLALRQDTNAVNARTLRQLSAIFSEEQLEKYKAIQEEQRERVRDRIQ